MARADNDIRGQSRRVGARTFSLIIGQKLEGFVIGRFCPTHWRPQRPVCLGALVSVCFVVVVILPILLHSYVEATSEGVTKTLFQIPGLDR